VITALAFSSAKTSSAECFKIGYKRQIEIELGGRGGGIWPRHLHGNCCWFVFEVFEIPVKCLHYCFIVIRTAVGTDLTMAMNSVMKFQWRVYIIASLLLGLQLVLTQ
jgi:hypothetical protein